MDRDPELDVTVSDGRQVLTFQIAALAGHDAWVIVEPRAPRRVIRGCAAALDARQRVDTQIAARLAAGWVPVDRWPAGAPPAPLPPDLVVQMRRLLEVLASAREALQAADPRGRLWAACALFLHQARRFGVASPRPRLARAARERRLGELAEQAGDRPAAIFYYRAALAAYPRVGVTRRLARLEGPGPAGTAPGSARPASGGRRRARPGRFARPSPACRPADSTRQRAGTRAVMWERASRPLRTRGATHERPRPDRRQTARRTEPPRPCRREAAEDQSERLPHRGPDAGPWLAPSRRREGATMTQDDLARTLDAVANQMQVVAGLTTALRRSVTADAQTVIDLEGAVDRVVRLLRDLQPKHTAGG